MSTKCILAFIVLAVLPLFTFAQESPAPSEPATAELTTLLKDFLAGASRNDVAMHDRFWADDLIYTASAGRRIGKADIMRDVRNEPRPKAGEDFTIYTAEDIRIQHYLNTGTFLKRGGR
jgi:hypothetical protein